MDNTPTEEPVLTFGEQLVGKTFNPSGSDKVARLKELAAEMVDILADNSATRGYHDDITRLVDDGAMGAILAAQMMAVKSVTLKK